MVGQGDLFVCDRESECVKEKRKTGKAAAERGGREGGGLERERLFIRPGLPRLHRLRIRGSRARPRAGRHQSRQDFLFLLFFAAATALRRLKKTECVARGTRLRLFAGGTRAVENVMAADVLLGRGGRAVDLTKAPLPGSGQQMFTIEQEAGNMSYDRSQARIDSRSSSTATASCTNATIQRTGVKWCWCYTRGRPRMAAHSSADSRRPTCLLALPFRPTDISCATGARLPPLKPPLRLAPSEKATEQLQLAGVGGKCVHRLVLVRPQGHSGRLESSRASIAAPCSR